MGHQGYQSFVFVVSVLYIRLLRWHNLILHSDPDQNSDAVH